MKMNLEELDIDLTAADLNGEDKSWLVSYSDIVTVLLCFFIIFYSIEKKLQKSALSKIIDPLSINKKNNGEGPGASGDFKESIIKPHDKLSLMKKEMLALMPQKDFLILKTKNEIEVRFSRNDFFRSGSYQLMPQGISQLEKLVTYLRPYSDKFKVSIEGHTDTTPVKDKEQRWWKSNMELSVLRALSAYNFFIKMGHPKEFLSVTGHGDVNGPIEGSNKRNLRRITLRIKPLFEREVK